MKNSKSSFRSSVVPATLAFILILAAGAPAATFNVSSPSAFQAALNTAASNGENDTINVTAGTFYLTSTLSFYSTENYDLLIDGAGTGLTVLDGGTANQIMSLRTTAGGADVAVWNITLRNGSSSTEGGGLHVQTDGASIEIHDSSFDDNESEIMGGGANLVSTSGDITVSGCGFHRNSGETDAGGLNAGSSSGTITLTGSTFEDNIVPGVHPGVPAWDGGGAILYIDGSGQVVMTGNIFTGNQAADGAGGCMTYFIGSGVHATISGNTFTGNTAQLDGGGCFTRINDNGTITFTDNVFTGNTTVTAGGAGSMIYLNAGSLDCSGNTYSGNDAGGDGGGLWLWNGTGSLDISWNSFTENETGENGGGAVVVGDNSNIVLERNVFDTNTAANVGGGLSYATAGGTVELGYNTFYGNQAAGGGGVYLYFDQAGAQASAPGNILWNDSKPEVDMSGAVSTALTYSDIDDGTGEPWFGTGCIDADPIFENAPGGDFQITWDNFPTPDATKSPCIDTGDPSSPVDPDGTRADMGVFFFDQQTGIEEGTSPVGAGVLLGTPNPFSGSTVITCTLPQGTACTGDLLNLSVYDLGGHLVTTLVEDEPAASHTPVSASWDGRDGQGRSIPSGTYIAELAVGEFRRTGKLLILR